MKLSEAIEYAIASGAYGITSFMCIALKMRNQEEHVNAVHDLVERLHGKPCSYRDTPMHNVLHDLGLIHLEKQELHEQMHYSRQLYCWWWVFDLKRKGL